MMTNLQLRIQINTPADPDDIAAIESGLENFNNESSTIKEVKPLHITATGKDAKVNGGAIGRTWSECCELQKFWVDVNSRGKGIGTLLMDAFEQEAINRDCKLIYLETFAFQAPLFYEKRGYEEVLRISGFSGGEEKVFMQKNLDL